MSGFGSPPEPELEHSGTLSMIQTQRARGWFAGALRPIQAPSSAPRPHSADITYCNYRAHCKARTSLLRICRAGPQARGRAASPRTLGSQRLRARATPGAAGYRSSSPNVTRTT